MKKGFTLFLMCFAPLVSAKPIDFLNLNWSMSPDAMVASLKSDGFRCYEPFPGSGPSCEKGKSGISIKPNRDEIFFTCASYNGCKLDAIDMSKLIAKKYGIKMVAERTKNIFQKPTIQYCGKGSDGDKICLIKNHSGSGGTDLPGVKLYKGSLGASRPSF